jgi:hypothetical protein
MSNRTETKQEFLGKRISDKRAELLLTEWTNIPMHYPQEALKRPFTEQLRAEIAKSDKAIARMVTRYPEVFSAFPRVPAPPNERDSEVATRHWFIAAGVQEFLRLAWDAPDMRAREWHIFAARQEFHSSTVYEPAWLERFQSLVKDSLPVDDRLTEEEYKLKLSVPDFTPFEQTMYHLQRLANRLRHCANPECAAPYFLAGKKGQKYCTSRCSGDMQRVQKRDWWRRNLGKVN